MKKGKTVGAAVSVAKILDLLGRSSRPMNASQIAKALGMYRGTTYNILWTLEDCGIVHFREIEQGFVLSTNMLAFTQSILSRSGLIDFVRPMLFSINERFGVTCFVGRITPDNVVFVIDSVGTTFRDDPFSTVGRRYPSSGAPGMVIAAHRARSDAEIANWLKPEEWFKAPTAEVFVKEVFEARERGYAIDTGRRWQRLTQVTAPVLNAQGGLALLLTNVIYMGRLSESQIEEMALATREAAWRIGDILDKLQID